jgi:hypothetical protein
MASSWIAGAPDEAADMVRATLQASPPTVYFTLTEDELYPEYHPRT